jgi:hypothetical protein
MRHHGDDRHRVLSTRRERVQVTLLLALGVPCSAQLGVVLGMLAGTGGSGMLVWATVLVLVIPAVASPSLATAVPARLDIGAACATYRPPREQLMLVRQTKQTACESYPSTAVSVNYLR